MWYLNVRLEKMHFEDSVLYDGSLKFSVSCQLLYEGPTTIPCHAGSSAWQLLLSKYRSQKDNRSAKGKQVSLGDMLVYLPQKSIIKHDKCCEKAWQRIGKAQLKGPKPGKGSWVSFMLNFKDERWFQRGARSVNAAEHLKEWHGYSTSTFFYLS